MSKTMKFFSVLVAWQIFMMPVYAFKPLEWGRGVRNFFSKKTEPVHRKSLVDYVYPEKSVTIEEHNEFLDHLSREQQEALWKALKGKEDASIPENLGTAKLNEELLWVTSHWLTYPFEETVDYTAIVRWTAGKLDVPKAECDYATTFQLEHAICEKILAKMWDKLTSEEKAQVLKESGVAPSNVGAYAALTGAGLITALGTSAALMGFPFYILMAKTAVVAASAILGTSAAATISAISILTGPIGWTIAGVAATVGIFLIGRANAAKAAAYIIQVHVFKVMAMEDAKVNYSKYLLR